MQMTSWVKCAAFAAAAVMACLGADALAAPGNAYYVETTGSDMNDGLSVETAFATLTNALAHAGDNDIVYVGEGTYPIPKSLGTRKSGSTDISNGIPSYWLTNGVTVIGVKGAEKTIFDGEKANNRFAFLLDHENARVEGITVCRINTTIPWQVQESPCFEVKKGTLVNCVSRDHSLYYVGGINLRKGVLVGCRVANTSCSDGLSLGAGINRSQNGGAACITNCIVENCSGKQGPGLYLTQPATVFGCVIRGCTDPYGSRGNAGPVFVNNGSVTVENCIITNNFGYNGGGLLLQNGTVRNCLIADNDCTDTTGGGGVKITGGTLECCTVVGNTISKALDGAGVYQTGGTVRNCIISMNGADRMLANESNHFKVTGGTVTYTCTYPASITGEGNRYEDPMFVDLASHDYRLSSGSDLFDCGANQSWMVTAVDLDGNPRIEHDAVNLGCYETPTPAVKPLTCSFVSDVVSGGNPLTVTFTSSVKNAGDDVAYEWDFGDGGSSRVANPSHRYTGTGIYDVTLRVTSGDRSYVNRMARLITVGTSVAYVSDSGSGIWPYDTPEKATNDIVEAAASLYAPIDGYGRLVFRDGVYYPKEVVRITRPRIRFECENGPGRASVSSSRMSSKVYGVISLQAVTAVVDGLVFTNCSVASSEQYKHGSALTINHGTATNCVIAKCDSNQYTTSPLYMTGGTFTHGLIWGGSNTDSGAGGGGRAGFYINGSSAKLLCTVVSNNYGGPVVAGQLVSGLISNCTIVANNQTSENGNSHGILQIGGGMVANSRIIGNTYISAPAGTVELSGGTMRNCLVAGNVSKKSVGGVAVSGAGTMENCTVVGNEVMTDGNPSGLSVGAVKAQISNVIVAGNTGSTNELAAGGTATFTTCYLPVAPTNATSSGNVIGSDPCFRNPRRGDYRTRGNSSARNAGTTLSWMTDGATDLAGNPRILNGKVDIGCFECEDRGLMMLLR